MILITTKFKDLLIVKHKVYKDRRGSLRVTHNNKKIKTKFIYEYCTTSKKNSLRGFHFQLKFQQAKYVTVLKGKIFDVAVDVRKNSETFGRYYSCILSDKNAKSIYIPEGFAHGFYTLDDDNIVIYACTKYRNKNSEISIIYNDNDLNIKWPIKSKKVIISKKDSNAMTFSEFKKKNEI